MADSPAGASRLGSNLQRGKHLKCDGQTPCARCVASQSECVYIASRRGYKGPRRGTAQNPNKRHASSSPDAGNDVGDSCPMLLGAGAGMDTATAASLNHLQLYSRPPPPPPPPLNGHFLNPLEAVHRGAPLAPAVSIADKCLEAFYHQYYAAHPFVLPKEHLAKHMRETGHKPEALLAAMRYVGALYLDAGPARAGYLDEATRLVRTPTTPKDGFLVQALLLLLVALDGSCQQDRARDLLAEAEATALEIGLHTRPFAVQHGRGNAVLEESWRRTWWDLYVVDGMVAGVHRETSFALFDIPADVALPCEEADYRAGVCVPFPLLSFLFYIFSLLSDPFLFCHRRSRSRPCTLRTLTTSCLPARTGPFRPLPSASPPSATWAASCAVRPSCLPRTRTWRAWTRT